MPVSVDVRGDEEVIDYLHRVQTGQRATLQKAASAGAKALKPFIQAAAPRGATGKLRRSVSARKAKRDLPAAVVSPRPKIAFYRHMVIGGTKDHGPKNARVMIWKAPGGVIVAHHVSGTSARPFVDEGYQRGKSAMDRAIDAVIATALEGV